MPVSRQSTLLNYLYNPVEVRCVVYLTIELDGTKLYTDLIFQPITDSFKIGIEKWSEIGHCCFTVVLLLLLLKNK